ncbi:MAG: hypothetical protein A2508_00255 [Candidatus Lambdaproteobacteria bacterium RIFOXYD12_FULL_49_8]|uniref:Uncharacterized protein n=1 Tax=Candidatus Lambdaproteobacteria bacterium RIFOXYD2_FULL_50_16 TaxID=1817772 RepID=A0A1F6GFH4_9PROT|nr:MAG: hypothetical protein A2527_00300 [Candidatus Lambdaproteobacteria bacterium RIFOXYD2_FULL_50_16]OGG97315.1 MAG: hypothetical protein A2508_00255 [Candidatus Lambdaproteobacteria bacterium RIFOXYD12_FULL_49_8]
MHYEDLITDLPGAKRELVLFSLVLFMLTTVNAGMLFVRGYPLIQHRQYDFETTFEFREIMHDGDLRFKACFHKSVAGGFYLCFLFPPPKSMALREGRYSPEHFERIFVDTEYTKKYVDQFRERRVDLSGFDVVKTKDSYRVTPIFYRR